MWGRRQKIETTNRNVNNKYVWVRKMGEKIIWKFMVNVWKEGKRHKFRLIIMKRREGK